MSIEENMLEYSGHNQSMGTGLTNYQKLPRAKKDVIDKFFADWKSNKSWSEEHLKSIDSDVVYANYKGDHFLDESAFIGLTDFIINSKRGVEKTLRDLIDHILNNYLFLGGRIGGVFPILVGSVFIRQRLINFLVGKHGNLFSEPAEVEKFFATDPTRLDPKRKKCFTREKEWHIWVTWNEKNSLLCPFSFSEGKSKKDICASLGLGDRYLQERTVLATFLIDSSNEHAKRPTIADANFDNIHWRPTSITFTDYGLTSPDPLSIRGRGKLSKRPEAVIKSQNLTFSNLHRRLEKLE